MLRRSHLLALAPTGLFLAWLLLLRPSFLGGPAGYVMVAGRSMEPALYSGDLVVTSQQPEYQAGDVVAFRVPKGDAAEGAIVIHRIVGGDGEGGFVMRGDNKRVADPWRPKAPDVVGKQWLHLPGAGRWLAVLREPRNLGMAAAGLAALALIGGGQARRRRRKGGGHMASPRVKGSASGPLPAPPWALAALGALALLGVALAAGAFFSFRQPLEKARSQERLRYEHGASFDYSVQVQPSTLYPEGTIGPIAPPAAGAAAPITPTIYTKLARVLDVGFSYSLNSDAPLDVRGEAGAQLQIRAEGGWATAEELLAPRPFSGPAVSFRTTVDLQRAMSLVETIQKETGFNPGNYELAVVPTVRISGLVGNDPVDETYSPSFVLKMNRSQMAPASPLARTQPRSLADRVVEPQGYSLAGLWVSVGTARYLATVGSALALAAAAFLAAVIFLGLGRDEAARIRGRYSTMLISVARAELKEDMQRIEVASMADLARLARRDGRVIFHQELGAGSHLYFVPDGEVTYQYTVGEAARSGRPPEA